MAIFDTLGISGVRAAWCTASGWTPSRTTCPTSTRSTPTTRTPFQERFVVAQAVDYGSGDRRRPRRPGRVRRRPEGRIVYEPDHPLANEEGYVRYPDIDLGDQMVAADHGAARLPGQPRRRRAGHQRLPGRPAAREGLTMTSPLGGILPVGIGAVTGVAGATTGVPQAQNADGFAVDPRVVLRPAPGRAEDRRHPGHPGRHRRPEGRARLHDRQQRGVAGDRDGRDHQEQGR